MKRWYLEMLRFPPHPKESSHRSSFKFQEIATKPDCTFMRKFVVSGKGWLIDAFEHFGKLPQISLSSDVIGSMRTVHRGELDPLGHPTFAVTSEHGILHIVKFHIVDGQVCQEQFTESISTQVVTEGDFPRLIIPV